MTWLGGRTLSDNAYTYNNVGNRLDVTPNSNPKANYYDNGLQKNIDYGYDTLQRVTTATYNTDSESETFDMDVLGNRTQYTKRNTSVDLRSGR